MDTVGRRPVLLAAGLGNAIAVGSMALPENLGAFLLAIFVGHRVLQIALFTAMLTLAADVVPAERRAQGLAVFGLGGLIPLATGGALGDLVLRWGGFDRLFMVAALVSAASWMLIWRVPRLPMNREKRRSFWASVAQRDLLPVWWLTLLFAAGIESIFTFLRTFVDETGIGTVGGFFLVYGGVAIVVRIGGNRLFDRVDQLALIVGSVGLYGAGYLVLGLAGSGLWFLLAAAILGLGHGVLFPILSALVVGRARDAERGSAMAIFTSLFDVAVLTAAPIVGAVIDWRGYSVSFSSVGMVILGGLLIYVAWDRRLVATPSEVTPPGR
jgi:predicted MFS family arabinose efflux permease